MLVIVESGAERGSAKKSAATAAVSSCDHSLALRGDPTGPAASAASTRPSGRHIGQLSDVNGG